MSIGERFNSAVEKIGNVAINFGERVLKILTSIEELRDKLLERFDIEYKDYIILKLQIFALLFFLFSAVFIVNFISLKKYIIFAALFGFLSIYTIFIDVKKFFSEDFPAYRDVFLAYLMLSALLAIIKIKKPSISLSGFPYMHYVAVSVAGVVLISLYFKKRYARDFTYGRVIEADFDFVKVKINYDIRANMKPCKCLLKNSVNARKGDIVKIMVKRKILGSRAIEVMGVKWE